MLDHAQCTPDDLELRAQGNTLRDVGIGTLIVGGVAAATGAVVLFTVGGGLSVDASAGPGGAGLRATGHF